MFAFSIINWWLTLYQVYDWKQPGCRDLSSFEFTNWLASNASWLKPYAAFCFLRDLFKTADHRQWGCMGKGAAEHVERITSPTQEYHATIQFTYWLQWHLHKQLLEVSMYAAERCVVLKGDLPIGTLSNSSTSFCLGWQVLANACVYTDCIF